MRKLMCAVLCLMVAGCTGGAFKGAPAGFLVEPTREHILAMAALLPPQEAKELPVYNDEHDKVWGFEVHVKDTCPFLTYWPAYIRHDAGQTSELEWAEFLHEFFEAKHEDEGHCDCDEMLAGFSATGTLTIEE